MISALVAYYNFLRPQNNYKVLNEVEMLSQADTMLGKWQLLIFLWSTDDSEPATRRSR